MSEDSSAEVISQAAQGQLKSIVERWLPIAGFEDRYEVSSLGRVRSLMLVTKASRRPRTTPLVLRPAVHSNGYLSVGLRDGARHEQHSVHRLVLRTFVGDPGQGEEGAHLDGSRANNVLTNLVWVSRKVNHSHKALHGTLQRGERCGKAKLKAHEVASIRSRFVLRSPTNGAAALAREYDVSPFAILSAVNGRTWNVPEAHAVGEV